MIRRVSFYHSSEEAVRVKVICQECHVLYVAQIISVSVTIADQVRHRERESRLLYKHQYIYKHEN